MGSSACARTLCLRRQRRRKLGWRVARRGPSGADQAIATLPWAQPPVIERVPIEKRATFACTPGLPADARRHRTRPGGGGRLWTAGPLPATLEGAVRAWPRRVSLGGKRSVMQNPSHEGQAATDARHPGAERMFALLGPARQPPRPGLAESPEQPLACTSTAHRILNDLTIGRFVTARSRQLPAGHAAAGARQPARPAGRARRRHLPAMRELHVHPPAGQPLGAPRATRSFYIERTYLSARACRWSGAGWAALHLTSVGKLFLASDDLQRVRASCHAHRFCRPHAQQPDRAGQA